jgi:AcrR family transcriptional regulator
MSDDQPRRKQRVDMVRNRAKILAVAETHFTAHGVTTSLEAVAKEAGVGVATLHRHFPSRDALLAELLQAKREELVQRQRSIDEQGDAALALAEWLSALEDYFSLYGGLTEPLAAAARESESGNPLAGSCQDLIAATTGYLEAAQRTGHARRDLTGRDLFLAVNAMATIRGSGAAEAATLARLRTVMASGYRID